MMKIGKTKLEAVIGNIAAMEVDAVVNPSNNMLWMGGGASASIRKNGGDSIESDALTRAPADIGSAVCTSAGTLKARWVIHAVLCDQDLVTNEKNIRQATGAVFREAETLKCTSIALPMLNTGEYDVEIHTAAAIMVDVTVNYLVTANKSLVRVVFAADKDSIKDIFSHALREKFTRHG
ncbi:hypothetical protein ES708_26122 [subsurface metagenome]